MRNCSNGLSHKVKKLSVNSVMLSEKADLIAEAEHVENFKCNPSWIDRF